MQIEHGIFAAPTSLGELPAIGADFDLSKNDWLQAQKAMSHLIAQTSTDAFVAIDTCNRIIYWNSGAEHLFGWCVEDIIGQSLDLIIPHAMRAGHAAGVRRLAEGHTPRLVGKTTEVTALHRDGHSVAIELSLTHWSDPSSGKPAGYASVMRDVSEKRRLEAERDAYGRKLEEQLAAIEATSDGVAITDADGNFIYMNPIHAAMFGYSDPAMMIGKHWSTLYSPHEARRIELEAIPVVFAKGHWRGDARGTHRDGSVIEQEVALSVSPNGGLVCTTRDIGERQRTLRERIRTREKLLLAERQEIIGRAVTGLAHDFANLMAVISASAASLKLKMEPGSPELDRLKDAAAQATSMVEMMLAPAKVAKSEQVVDARGALENVVDLTALSLKPDHVIRLSHAEEGLSLRADRTEFLRVMMNLCSNARDALPPDAPGQIEIRAERFDPAGTCPPKCIGTMPQGPAARITVSDTGCGIALVDRERIFKPFHTTKSYGTGLGLSVVSSLVVEAGGCIGLESSDSGTVFHVVWPLADGQPGKPAAAAPDIVEGPELTGMKVLAVDDNEAVLGLIETVLLEAGADVTICSDPLAALELINDDPAYWDALIVDYDMPEMNGAELATAATAIRPQLPVVLCTALLESENTFGPAPFAGYVTKSELTPQLPRTLRRALAKGERTN